jgi:hypothetical protein
MKIAIIGNSHIGALKRGWDVISGAFPSVEVVFFGAKGESHKDLALEGRTLVARRPGLRRSIEFTSGGLTSIDLDDYDMFLVYGLSSNPYFADIDGKYSRKAIEVTMRDRTEGRLGFKIVMMIASACDKPIYVGHNPLRAERRNKSSQDLTAYLDGLAQINAAIYEPLGVHLVGQPADTIVNGRNTELHFTQGSKRLETKVEETIRLHDEEDRTHMNDEFGVLWMRKFLAQVTAAQSVMAD